MKRFIISLEEPMYDKMMSHCEKLHYTKSEYVRSLIRKELFKEAIYPGIAKAEKEVMREIRPSVEKTIEAMRGKPMFCKKHKGSRIGDHYSCGCKV